MKKSLLQMNAHKMFQEVAYPSHDTIHTNDETPSEPQDLKMVTGVEDTCLEVTWRPPLPNKGLYCVDTYNVTLWSSDGALQDNDHWANFTANLSSNSATFCELLPCTDYQVRYTFIV